MTKAPQAIPEDTDTVPPTDPTPPEPVQAAPKKRGRPKGSSNGKSKPSAAAKGVNGEVTVRLQIVTKTEQGTYDFDREGRMVGEVSQGAVEMITGWFNTWKTNLK